jgi:hypothetical protein
MTFGGTSDQAPAPNAPPLGVVISLASGTISSAATRGRRQADPLRRNQHDRGGRRAA